MCCNTRFAGALLVLFVLMNGCGNEDGFAPVLVSYDVFGIVMDDELSFMRGHSDPNTEDSKVLINGEVSFQDPDGDVVLLRVTWQDCARDPVKKLETIQDDLNRTSVGTMEFKVRVSTECPIGNYAVRLSAMDKRGYTSNVLAVPYEIYE